MHAVARSLHKLLKPLALRQGFADVRVLSQWSDIVGPDMARQMQPQTLKNGVLQVAVSNSSLALQIQHQAPQLMEKINRFFGFRAVKSIRPVQTYFALEPQPQATVVVPDAGAQVRAEAQVSQVQDPELKAALSRLGAQVEARHSPDWATQTDTNVKPYESGE